MCHCLLRHTLWNTIHFVLSCLRHPSHLEIIMLLTNIGTWGPWANPLESSHIKRATANYQVEPRAKLCFWFSSQVYVHLHEHHFNILFIMATVLIHGFFIILQFPPVIQTFLNLKARFCCVKSILTNSWWLIRTPVCSYCALRRTVAIYLIIKNKWHVGKHHLIFYAT